MVKKYVAKPKVFEALQWTGTNKKEVIEFIGMDHSDKYMFYVDELYITDGMESKRKAEAGDYIIKEEDGGFHVCEANDFESQYEEVI